jgi:RNA polymerase sigma-70 factor (ECF subfamily)
VAVEGAKGTAMKNGIKSEGELVERAQRGDEQAFAALFELHKRRVYALCLRMTSNPSQAEDLAQDAFLQVFRKIATFRGQSAFSTWLHRLVVNVVLMQLRKKAVPQVSLDEVDTPAEESVKREYGKADFRLKGSIDRVALQRAIRQLPMGYRAILVLHDIEGYEHNEIATLLNCSIGNSKSQLHKARMRLRELLTKGRRAPSTQVWGAEVATANPARKPTRERRAGAWRLGALAARLSFDPLS